MCRRVLNKTIILLGFAGYEMIITNEARSASLVIYYFIGKIYLVICYFRQDS